MLEWRIDPRGTTAYDARKLRLARGGARQASTFSTVERKRIRRQFQGHLDVPVQTAPSNSRSVFGQAISMAGIPSLPKMPRISLRAAAVNVMCIL